MELETLMTERHSAYQAAKAIDFKPGAATQTWRSANRAYVTARTRHALKHPKIEVLRPMLAPQGTEQPDIASDCRKAA